MERVLVILVHWISQRGHNVINKEENRETENITLLGIQSNKE